MRKTITLLIVLFTSFSLHAQITIESTDVPVSDGSLAKWFKVAPAGLSVPSAGAGQVWNYTGLTQTGTEETTFISRTHGGFPACNFMDSTEIVVFPNLPQQRLIARQVDATQYALLGREAYPVSASLGSITGVASDSINYIHDTMSFTAPQIVLPFPANYGDVFSSDYVSITRFIMDATPFAITNALVEQKQYITRMDTITGWGTLTLTNPATSQNVSIDALLIKESYMLIDSFFINGAAAPPTLVSAFGYVQGDVYKSVKYTFRSKGLTGSAFNIVLDDSGIPIEATVFYDLGPATTGIHGELGTLPVSVYPNPARSDFFLEFENTGSGPYFLEIFNSLGAKVAERQVAPGQGSVKESFHIASGAGIYHYAVRNAAGSLLATGKVLLAE
jgi:hypothetical protein